VDYNLQIKSIGKKGEVCYLISQKSGDPKEISIVDREEGHKTINLVERSNTQSRSRVIDLGGQVSTNHQL
jgi:hypothetical protein